MSRTLFDSFQFPQAPQETSPPEPRSTQALTRPPFPPSPNPLPLSKSLRCLPCPSPLSLPLKLRAQIRQPTSPTQKPEIQPSQQPLRLFLPTHPPQGPESSVTTKTFRPISNMSRLGVLSRDSERKTKPWEYPN